MGNSVIADSSSDKVFRSAGDVRFRRTGFESASYPRKIEAMRLIVG